MRKLHKERLIKLAEFLKKVPRERFDLETYVTGDNSLVRLDAPKNCGTTACALGWCPVVFPRSTIQGIFGDPMLRKPRLDVFGGFCWAMHFFGISSRDAEYMFTPSAYRRSHRGPKSVANRILDFVAKDGQINRNTKAYKREYY